MRYGPRGIVRLLWSIAVMLIAIVPAVAQQDREAYDRGRSAVFEERWPDVRRQFEEFVRRFPGSSHADGARYWLGMALYEMGEAEEAYSVLKKMNEEHPESPWNDDGRVLMVRCAEAALKAAATRRPAGMIRSEDRSGLSNLVEYEAFIERSTRDRSSKVQLLAIDTMLGARPDKAPELLTRLSSGKASREATGMVLDRFFGPEQVKVTIEDPARGLTDENVAVMVRQGDEVTYLTLTESLALVRDPREAPPRARFGREIRTEIRDKLLRAERGLVREGDPGSVQTLQGGDGRSMSAIVKVVDGEVHYYRNGNETTRIVVLRRRAGFNADNIRMFVETRSGVREIGLEEARRLPSGGPATGLSEGTIRYLKASLAIIEIDLERAAGSGTD